MINNGFTLSYFGLPTCIENVKYEINFNEMNVPFEKDILQKNSINSLSTKQRKIFVTDINSLNNVINYKNNQGARERSEGKYRRSLKERPVLQIH